MTKRRCMVCRLDLLKGFFRHRTDPICIDCNNKVRQQRRLLTLKYKQQYRAQKSAERRAFAEHKASA